MLVMVKSEDEELMIGFAINNMGIINILEMSSIFEVMEAKCKLQFLDYNLHHQHS